MICYRARNAHSPSINDNSLAHCVTALITNIWVSLSPVSIMQTTVDMFVGLRLFLTHSLSLSDKTLIEFQFSPCLSYAPFLFVSNVNLTRKKMWQNLFNASDEEKKKVTGSHWKHNMYRIYVEIVKIVNKNWRKLKDTINIKGEILIQFWLNFLFTFEQISANKTEKKCWQRDILRWFTQNTLVSK